MAGQIENNFKNGVVDVPAPFQNVELFLHFEPAVA